MAGSKESGENNVNQAPAKFRFEPAPIVAVVKTPVDIQRVRWVDNMNA